MAEMKSDVKIDLFPNPASDLIAIQVDGLVLENLMVELFDLNGKLVASKVISKGSTIAYFDVQTLYSGMYVVRLTGKNLNHAQEVMIQR
jgi:hypothetical protein